MASKKPRSFHEPWVAVKSALHGKCPDVGGVPEDAAQLILDAWHRIERDAEWVIWGSQMAEPCICKNLDGSIAVTDSQRIIAIRRTLGLPKGAPDHEDVSKRITRCVNALAGVADPEKFVTDVRALLLGYARGECEDPRQDNRVVSLLGRCIPPEEVERFRHEEAED